jgi:hypothetical protein
MKLVWAGEFNFYYWRAPGGFLSQEFRGRHLGWLFAWLCRLIGWLDFEP